VEPHGQVPGHLQCGVTRRSSSPPFHPSLLKLRRSRGFLRRRVNAYESKKTKKGERQPSMSVLSGTEQFNRHVIMWLEAVGVIAILTMMVITCVDVMGAKILLLPVLGAIDIVMLAQLVAISFGTASALILGRHVTVEFFVMFLPPRLQAAVEVLVNLLGLLLFVIITWRLIIYGYYMQTGGEVSPTARIPLYLFAYGIAFASIPVCLTFLLEGFKSLTRVMKK